MSTKRTGSPLTVVSVKAKEREVKVLLSNGDKISLSVDSFTEFHLYAGKELTQEELDGITAYANQDEAYDKALRYLGRDSYSAAEIQRKLTAKGFEPGIIESVITRLTKAGLIDDVLFAKTFAQDVADLRLLGEHRILRDLRMKGVSESIIATLTFPREAELDKATRLASSLDRRYFRTPYGKRLLKIKHALIERGFDEDVVAEAANACVSPSDPNVEKAELDKAFALAYAKYSRKYEGYDLSQHILAALARKGFGYDEVKTILEEHDL